MGVADRFASTKPNIMKRFSQTLLAESEEHLRQIHARHENPVGYSEEAIKFLISVLERLKTFALKYKFGSKQEEIEFFRDIKPRFSSWLIYYNEVYSLELNRPVGSEKQLKKYYKSELGKLKSFFDDNLEFYRYYRSGSHELDGKYFVRGKFDLHLSLDSFYLQADTRFSTAQDYKVARILATEKLTEYLQTLIAREEMPVAVTKRQGPTWTAPKVALVELIYALQAQGVLNNGTADLREMAAFFEQAFNIELGQYHKTFLEIRERKYDRAKFLSSLKDKLIQRMDDADETVRE